MKKILLGLLSIALSASFSYAAEVPAGNKSESDIQVTVNNIDRTGDLMTIDLDLDFSKVNLQRNKQVVYTPILVNGNDTASFAPFSLAGHNRYIFNYRNGLVVPVVFKGWGKDRGELSPKSVPVGSDYAVVNEGQPVIYNYVASTQFQDWMEVSTLLIKAETVGCSNCGSQSLDCPLASVDFTPEEFVADYIFITPVAEEIKTREISGRAYVDFKVNKTNILPDYRNNKEELAKIIATIDSIKSDKDITIKSIEISGTASPEGPYDNNVRLAKGRTEALKNYVQGLYDFPEGFIKTSYEPVDWQGLREWLESNDIENKAEILAIVNSDMEPYARNSKIRSEFPKQYAWLLQNVYPSLRHSDYVVEFNIRKYKDVEEITEVMLSAPAKLSLNELFLVANSQPENSELYVQAFEIAAAQYPEDEVAKANAATSAMKRGDFTSADKYLTKEGKTDEYRYTRAIYNALNGDKQLALKEFDWLAKNAKSVLIREKSASQAQSLEASLRKAKKFTTL